MKIKRTSLINDLNKVMPGIATGNSIIDGADTVVFNDGHIYSYNSSISVDVVETEKTGLKGVIKAVDFYKALSKLVSDEIEVEDNGKEWIIKDGKIKVKMTLLPSGTIFERFESLKPNDTWVEIDGADFNRGLSICFMPKNASKYAGVYIKDNVFTSTDAFQINTYDAKNEYPNCFISNDSVTQLLKWTDFNAIEMNKNWIQFKSSNGTVFSVRSLATDIFPSEKIAGVVKSYLEYPVLMESSFTPDFYDAVERAAIFSKEDEGHEVIDMHITTEGCAIKSERTSGAFEEHVDDIKSAEGEYQFEIDIAMVRGCKSYFDTFRLAGDENRKILVLSKDSSLKISSVII